MFRLYPNPKGPPTAAAIESAKTALRRVESRQALLSRLVALNLTKQDPQLGQVDMHDVPRMLLIFHVYNVEMRRALFRRFVDVPEELERLLAARSDIAALGTRDGASPRLEAPFWVVFFDFVRLPPWNVVSASDRVVLARDHHMFESRLRREELPDTRHFVHFYHGLRKELFQRNPGVVPRPRHAEELLPADVVMLYFASILLIGKNVEELVARPRFDYLDEPAAERTSAITGRRVVIEFMRANDPHIERPRESDEDFLKRILPVQSSLAALLSMMECDFDSRYTVPSAVDVKRPVSYDAPDEEETTTTPPVSDEKESKHVTIAPDVPADDDGDDDAAADDADDAVEELPAPADEDWEPNKLAALPDAETPQAAEAAIKSELVACPYHVTLREHGADGLCPAPCVRARLGAHVAAQIGASVLESRAITDAIGVAPRAAQLTLVLTALTPTSGQNARAALLSQYSAPASVVRQPSTPAEWARLMGCFDHVGSSVVDLGAADDLAVYGGWEKASPRERLARYTTLYGAPAPISRAWTHQGWAWNPSVEMRMNVYRDYNPRVPLRTLQTVAHLIS